MPFSPCFKGRSVFLSCANASHFPIPPFICKSPRIFSYPTDHCPLHSRADRLFSITDYVSSSFPNQPFWDNISLIRVIVTKATSFFFSWTISTNEGIAFVGQRSVKMLRNSQFIQASFLSRIFSNLSPQFLLNIELELNKYTILEQHETCLNISWKRTMDLWNKIVGGCEFEARFFRQ